MWGCLLCNDVVVINYGQKENFTTKIQVFFQDQSIIKMKYFFILYAIFFLISMFYIWNNFIRK